MMTDATQRSQVRGFYDQQAAENPRHAAVLGEPNDFAASYREYQELLSLEALLPIDTTESLIEFGCGGGRWLHALAPRVGVAVGVDLSEKCVELCRQRFEAFGNVSVHHADIQEFSPIREYDLMYYSGVLLYLSDEAIHDCLEKHLPHLSDRGLVLVRDSLALHRTHQISHPQGYRAIYRSLESWREIFDRHDFDLAGRQRANRRPLRNRARNSRPLQAAHRWARSAGVEKQLLGAVSALCGYGGRMPDKGEEYSHDFMLYTRRT